MRTSISLGVLALILLFSASLAAQEPQILYYKMNEGTGTTTANSAVPGGASASLTFNIGNSWGPGQLGAAGMNFTSSRQMSSGLAPNLTNNDSWTIEFRILQPDSPPATCRT